MGVHLIPWADFFLFEGALEFCLMKCLRFREHFGQFQVKSKKNKLRLGIIWSIPHIMDLSDDPSVLLADPSRARRMMPMEEIFDLPFQ
jgi:hypothetical protein